MKKKSLLLTAVATLGLTTATMAQNVPSYVSTNGLVGWWPFNGNANDESGNGNNGTVNGATLTTDRFGNASAAYFFSNNGVVQNIQTNYAGVLGQNNRTISLWYLQDVISTVEQQVICGYGGSSQGTTFAPTTLSGKIGLDINNARRHYSNSLVNQWNHAAFVYETGNNLSQVKIYLNGVLENNASLTWGDQSQVINTTSGINFRINAAILTQMFLGKIDDIGIWNRALTQQEITNLYNALNCANNTTITPQTNLISTGNTATFTAASSDLNPNYVWQSDFGQGFQTLNNFGNYSGVNTSTLTINNMQLVNHLQQIRAISTSGNCIDTSNVATITLTDTCINYITVTDTLIINTTLSVLSPPNNVNTIKVYPNPASTHITIDYGDYTLMNGYTLQIVNTLGQTMYTTPISQQSSYIDLTTWTGNGVYFVQIIDPQSNVIENRKIVIQ